MSLLVSMSPAEPITPQAGLKSGPHPQQVTPPVTQPAPVKLRVPPPPASLLRAGTLSEHHLGTQHQPDLIPKPPAPGQGWKVLGKARRDFLPPLAWFDQNFSQTMSSCFSGHAPTSSSPHPMPRWVTDTMSPAEESQPSSPDGELCSTTNCP